MSWLRCCVGKFCVSSSGCGEGRSDGPVAQKAAQFHVGLVFASTGSIIHTVEESKCEFRRKHGPHYQHPIQDSTHGSHSSGRNEDSWQGHNHRARRC